MRRTAWALALAAALGAPMAVQVAGARARSPVELQTALAAADPQVAAFYRARAQRPLWVADGRLAPEARRVLALVRQADDDNLDPAPYAPERLEALLDLAERERRLLPEAELAVSQALAAYVRDLRTPPPAARLHFTDKDLQPPSVSAEAVLGVVAAAPTLAAGLEAATRMNPVYTGLKAALAEAGPQEAELAALNLERARALPPDMGRRYVLVDVAAQRLWYYQDGQALGSMKVVVGKPGMETPAMAALIRYAVYSPYWNLPQDLVRERARNVLRQGVGVFESERLQALSDWTPAATALDPAQVDWAAVAAGQRPLRVRQLPGPSNTMGGVKLMLPNRLGIYLHDTPQRWAFQRERRTMSSGCVRLEDAHTLARWLLGGDPAVTGDPEQRVDLAEPVPVYIAYFTAAAHDGRLAQAPDIYRRDAPLMAELAGRGRVELARSGAGT